MVRGGSNQERSTPSTEQTEEGDVTKRWALILAGALALTFFSATAVMAGSTPLDIYSDYGVG